MYYSKRLNLLFIAAPKTGSTTVESVLTSLDPDGERFRITLEDRTINSSFVATDSLGHARAQEFRNALGPDHYDSLRTFGFVRHPIEKLVSAYSFTRQRSLRRITRARTRSRVHLAALVTKRIISTLAARILPFSLWAILFPMKRCSNYFLDESGEVMVDYLGSTERLNEDLKTILIELGIPASDLDVPHLNKSVRSNNRSSIRPGMFYNFLARRYAEDIRLYSLVEAGILRVNTDERG